MGLTNVVKEAEQKNNATAPATAPTAPAKGVKAKTETQSLYEEFKEKGRAIRDAKSAEEKALEGSKSDKVVYVAALADPSSSQYRKANNENIASYKVVGYRFKALEDMEVPVSKLKVGFKNELDTEPITTRTIKAGEEFDLNRLETGYLMGRNEYAGKFTGDGTTVNLFVRYAKDRQEPLPTLKLNDKGSVKEKLIFVAENIGDETKKNWKVKDEFAGMFDVLYMKKSTGKPGSGSAKKNAESAADIAAAFFNYVNNRA